MSKILPSQFLAQASSDSGSNSTLLAIVALKRIAVLAAIATPLVLIGTYVTVSSLPWLNEATYTLAAVSATRAARTIHWVFTTMGSMGRTIHVQLQELI